MYVAKTKALSAYYLHMQNSGFLMTLVILCRWRDILDSHIACMYQLSPDKD